MFKDRNQAGKILARKITQETHLGKEAVIVSLPRGGVVIGAIVSTLLKLPHHILIAKKISLPSNPELAVGAISSSQASFFINEDLIKHLGIIPPQLRDAIADTKKKIEEIKRKLKVPDKLEVANKTVIITDDGAATGATIISAIREVKNAGASRIIVALPVAPPETVKKIKEAADQVIVVERPELFFSVSQFYEDFPPVTWEEVKNLLKLQQGL